MSLGHMEMEISWNLYCTLENNLHLALHSYSTLYPQVNLMCMPLGCGKNSHRSRGEHAGIPQQAALTTTTQAKRSLDFTSSLSLMLGAPSRVRPNSVRLLEQAQVTQRSFSITAGKKNNDPQQEFLRNTTVPAVSNELNAK